MEAMAAGIPSPPFSESGPVWVGWTVEAIPWSQQPAALPEVLRQLQAHQTIRLGRHSRERYLHLFQRSVWLRQLEQWTPGDQLGLTRYLEWF